MFPLVQEAPPLLQFGCFAAKKQAFHQADAQSELELLSGRLGVITAKVSLSTTATKDRKMNTHIKAVTAAQSLLVDVCVWACVCE